MELEEGQDGLRNRKCWLVIRRKEAQPKSWKKLIFQLFYFKNKTIKISHLFKKNHFIALSTYRLTNLSKLNWDQMQNNHRTFEAYYLYQLASVLSSSPAQSHFFRPWNKIWSSCQLADKISKVAASAESIVVAFVAMSYGVTQL